MLLTSCSTTDSSNGKTDSFSGKIDSSSDTTDSSYGMIDSYRGKTDSSCGKTDSFWTPNDSFNGMTDSSNTPNDSSTTPKDYCEIQLGLFIINVHLASQWIYRFGIYKITNNNIGNWRKSFSASHYLIDCVTKQRLINISQNPKIVEVFG